MKNNYIKITSESVLKYYKGNIVFVYHYNKKTFMYNLMKVEESNFLPKMQALRVVPEKYDAESEAERMAKKVKEINQALSVIMKSKGKEDRVTKAEIDAKINELNNPTSAGKPKIERMNSFITDFEDWIVAFREKKRQEDILKGITPRKNHPTVKDYVSACNLLKDFQYDEFDDKPIRFEDIDMKFIEKLILYAYDDRGDDDEEEEAESNCGDEGAKHKYHTEGSLSNKTINKRFDCIFTFMNSFYKQLPNDIEKKPKLETIEKKIIRLDREELRQLEELEILEEHKELNYEYYRDCLVFLCYTGLRFGDFHKLNRTYYHEEDNLIVLETEKTRKHCEVFLFDKAKEIAEKYNFDFKPIYNQTLNRGIKNMLEAYDLFPNEITVDYLGAGGRNTIVKKKRDFISCHTGRRTYMSIMIENGMDLYDLISTTGHTPTSASLKRYIDLFGKKRMEKFRAMNERLK